MGDIDAASLPTQAGVGVLVGETCGLTEYVGRVVLHRSGRVDPDRTRVRCGAHVVNGCDNTFLIAESVSYVACLATTGGTGLGAFVIQCGEEQHFCCSPECALVAHAYCLMYHIRPAIAAVFASRESGRIAAADVAAVTLTPASADDTDARRTIRQLRTHGVATGKRQPPKRITTKTAV